MKKFIFLMLFSTITMAQEYIVIKETRPRHRIINTPVQICQQTPRQNSSLNIGTVIGGVAGAYLGSQMGTNGTNAVSTYIGTGIGAIIGQRAFTRNEYDTTCTTTYRTTEIIGESK